MTDGDEHFFMHFPPEAVEAMKAQQARHEMMYDDAVHTVHRALAEMDLDHLKAIKSLIHGIGDEPQAVGFWEGVMHSIIASRDKRCPACGRDHDAEMAELTKTENESVNWRGDRLIKMTEYHVEAVDDDNLRGPVRCTGTIPGAGPCGLEYVTLEDRMLRKPDECHGCQMRSAQG